jgi:hypothetical protein
VYATLALWPTVSLVPGEAIPAGFEAAGAAVEEVLPATGVAELAGAELAGAAAAVAVVADAAAAVAVVVPEPELPPQAASPPPRAINARNAPHARSTEEPRGFAIIVKPFL